MQPDKKHWLEADWPAPEWIHAGTTTRIGGVSQSPYATFNLALHVGDDKNDVLTNRQKLTEYLNLASEPCWIKQVHASNIINAKSDGTVQTADGSITDSTNTICIVLTADCLPLLLCNKAGTVVAAVHIGWRGFSKNIIARVLDKLSTANKQLMAWLGPCISAKYYEIDTVVYDATRVIFPGAEKCFTATRQGHWLMDLKQLVKMQLNNLNIDQVYISPYCTYSDTANFFSHRRDGTTGRMATMIWMDSRSGID